MDSRKQAVSIRMSAGDIRSVKKLARRLGVRDSDVIRLAVKSMLAKLGPLNDATVRGTQSRAGLRRIRHRYLPLS